MYCIVYCSESYSFVLTNVDGERVFGYCRRVVVSYEFLAFLQSGQCFRLVSLARMSF